LRTFLGFENIREQNWWFQFLDFSVLNKLFPGPKGTSEAIEFICPRAAVRQFVNAEIANPAASRSERHPRQ